MGIKVDRFRFWRLRSFIIFESALSRKVFMSISLFFGLPGCGKTTILTSIAYKELHKRKSKYEHIYSNVGLAIDGLIYIDNSCIGRYDIRNALILIDESTLFANSREYMQFSKDLLQYMVMHRHYNVDIIFFSQRWDSMDKNIRTITDRVYYVYKGLLLGTWFTRYYKIPYGIIIPSGKKQDGEKLGDIIQGYCKPPFLTRLFSPWVFRPRYYKYFDSWDCPKLKPLPLKYKEYSSFVDTEKAD